MGADGGQDAMDGEDDDEEEEEEEDGGSTQGQQRPVSPIQEKSTQVARLWVPRSEIWVEV